MTKKKHPISRAERLALKHNAEVQHTKPTHAKKRIKEHIKDEETLDALRQAAQYASASAAAAASLHELRAD